MTYRPGVVPVALLLALSAGSACGQTTWNNAAGGNWNNPANWNPMDVPNTLGESAILPDLGNLYVVSFDTSATIGAVAIDGTVSLGLEGGRSLTVGTGGLVNNGLITINTSGTSSTTFLQATSECAITGAGSIILNGVNSSSYARVRISAINATFTIGAEQVITGSGYLQQTGSGSVLAINGLVNADRNGEEIRLDGLIDATGGGIFMGSNGGFVNAGGDLLGGTLAGDVRLTSTGSVNGTTAINTNHIVAGQTGTIKGDGLVVDGVMIVNSNGTSGTASIQAGETTTLDGTGVIELNGVNSYSYAQLRQPISNSNFTIGSDLTIVGSGLITETGTNAWVLLNSTVNANRSGDVIRLAGSIDASGGGTLMGSNGGSVEMAAELVGGTFLGDVYGVSGSYSGVTASGANGVRSGSLELLNAGLHNQGQFNILGGSTVSLRGPMSLTNNGLVVLNSNGTSATAYLQAPESASILGAGEIRLNGANAPSYARLRASGAAAVLTIGPDQTVTGKGYLQSTGNDSLVSLLGTVNADESGGEIYMSGDVDASGGGVIMGTNGGYVTLACDLVGGTLAGGVRASSTGSVNGVQSINENFIPAGQSMILVGDGLTNNGTLTVNSSGTSSTSNLQANASATIDGAGIIELNGVSSYSYANIRVATPDTTLAIQPGQTIRGSGHIHTANANTAILLNCPVIADRDGDVIRLGGTIDATGGGTFEGINGGTVESAADLQGGTWLGQVYAVGGTLDGVIATGVNGSRNGTTRLLSAGLTNAGTFNIAAGSVVQLDGAGTLVNDGVILLNSNGVSSVAYIQSAAPSTIEGVGTIELNGIGNNAYARLRTANAGATLTVGSGQTIAGNGSIQSLSADAPVRIEGVVAPGFADGDPTASIQMDGQINYTPGTVTRIDFEGTNNSDFDRITGSATLTLDGTLVLSLVDGYLPAFEDRFTIVNTSTIVGQFSEVVSPQVGLGVFRIVKVGNNKIEAVWTCEADLNGDGNLDFFDVQNFLNAFANEALYGDYNGDGSNNFFDVQAFLNDFTAGCL